jgi:NitT/TauT family transport system ATP-binding protein
MQPAIVELKDVSLIYHEPHAETLAIDRIDLSIAPGEFVAIVGPSGCGKTSILNLLAGLMSPSAGTVCLMGQPVTKPGQNVGYMLQQDHLLPWRTIEDNILLSLQVKHMLTEETRAHALELLDMYGLSEFRRFHPRQLSGGMRQKVALIRTLAFDPPLLLLDEPFSALDYQTRLRISDEVHSIIRREGKTAILVTHDIAEAICMADRVLVFTARPARIKSEHRIELTAPDRPIARRNAPEFKDYFDIIWKELDTGEKRA